MKIPLYSLADELDLTTNGGEERYLLKLPLLDLGVLADRLDQLGSKPVGLVPPFDPTNLSYTARCMATIRDHFPHLETFAPVPLWCPRDFLRSAKAAGFQAFIFPFVDPWPSFQQVFWDLVEGKRVHVAGGEIETPGWTWSEEPLI